MGGDMLCLGCNLHEENPAPQARIACGFNPPAFMRRHMAAVPMGSRYVL